MNENQNNSSEIKILDLQEDHNLIENLKGRAKVVDEYDSQVEELWKIRNPKEAHSADFSKKEKVKQILDRFKDDELGKSVGKLVWYPWKETMVHILDDEYFQELRTARNKYLIEEEEQKQFEKYRVGIIGLSVGNNIAVTLRLQGGARRMKISDHDTLSLSNMNRMKVSLTDLGFGKTEITKRQILEIDPYSELKLYEKGVGEDNIREFLDDLDIVVDEVDDLKIKTLIRSEARKKKVPVLMLTDNDDGVLVDYYPYNRNQKTSLFHGVEDDLVMSKISAGSADRKEIAKLSSKIVGEENISERMIKSLKDVGINLYSWPQLGTAAIFSGVVGCYFIRMLATGKELNIKRSLVKINDLMPWN